MGLFDKIVSVAKKLNSFEYVVKIAPNQIGVYTFSHKGKPKYVGRAIENRPGQSPCGLRKRLQEHWRGASAGKQTLYELRNELTVSIKICNSVDEAKRIEGELIRRYDTVSNGWNERYED